MRYTRSACAASAASKASERRYAASNFSATAPPCLCRSSVGVTTRATYSGERGRHRAQSGLRKIPRAQLILQREESLAVGILRRKQRIVQREDQRIGIRHPAKTRRLHRRSHRDPVGQHDLDAHLVQHPRGVLIAALPFGGGLRFGGERRLESAGTQRDRVRLRLHVVHRQGVELAVARPRPAPDERGCRSP